MIFRNKCDNKCVFLPKIEITNKILESLIKTEVDLNVLKNVEVATEWQGRLKKDILGRRLASVLRLEKVDVNNEVIAKVLADDPGRDEPMESLALSLEVVVKEKDLQFVVNWLNCQRFVDQVVYLSTKFKQNDLGAKELIQINKLIGERLVLSESLGVRRADSFVENSVLNHPKAHEVEYQLEDLLNWNKSATNKEIHPVLKSILIFYELLRIRPFLHNNLLTATFFFGLMLGINGYDFSFVALEEEMFKNKQVLFDVMARVEESGGGVSDLMEVFVGMMAVATEKSRFRVLSVTGESVKYKTEGGRAVALTERQVALMEELTVKGQMTIKELRQVLPLVSDDTILRDLKDLVTKKMIRKRGKTKGAVYLLGKVKGFR